jgi:dihydroorotate dehydrogenase electron transfer subunit
LQQITASIASVRELGSAYFFIEACCPHIAKHARPGHFINVRCGSVLLRRPLAVFSVDGSSIGIFFKAQGKGTSWLAQRRAGEEIDILGPLGKGLFDENNAKRVILVAGGVGLAPLYFYLKYNFHSGAKKILFYGARNANTIFFQNELIDMTDECFFVTEDGSLGEKGLVNEELRRYFLTYSPQDGDLIMTCGPNAMIKEIISFAESENIPCQVSLESYMGCGCGVCLSCVIPAENPEQAGESYFRLCTEGPVVDSKKIDKQKFFNMV